jgi:hypothetical protein
MHARSWVLNYCDIKTIFCRPPRQVPAGTYTSSQKHRILFTCFVSLCAPQRCVLSPACCCTCNLFVQGMLVWNPFRRAPGTTNLLLEALVKASASLEGNSCPLNATNPLQGCPPGYFCPTASQRLPCPAGHFCPVGVRVTVTVALVGSGLPDTPVGAK